MGRISMFLWYRKLCFAILISILQSNTRLQGNVFSIQYSVFFAIVTLSMVIDCKQLFYIIYYIIIIYNILSIQKVVTRAKKTEY